MNPAETFRQLVVLSLSEIDWLPAVSMRLFTPAEGRWGRQGWTVVAPGRVPLALRLDALTCAYGQTA